MELLNEMNSEGRGKLAELRKSIEHYEVLARETVNSVERQEMLREAESHREQYSRFVVSNK